MQPWHLREYNYVQLLLPAEEQWLNSLEGHWTRKVYCCAGRLKTSFLHLQVLDGQRLSAKSSVERRAVEAATEARKGTESGWVRICCLAAYAVH